MKSVAVLWNISCLHLRNRTVLQANIKYKYGSTVFLFLLKDVIIEAIHEFILPVNVKVLLHTSLICFTPVTSKQAVLNICMEGGDATCSS